MNLKLKLEPTWKYTCLVLVVLLLIGAANDWKDEVLIRKSRQLADASVTIAGMNNLIVLNTQQNANIVNSNNRKLKSYGYSQLVRQPEPKEEPVIGDSISVDKRNK
ncbi:hypothetical protein LCGC14_1683250 [marine sediment metagenome]|uniref:Uncharacterized protein n=1 Tax=marine sediment metagenome TaxID=412755 RepID=A0A0F9KMZ6_9ZZZZ|nr:hypothetical protein [Candidatus Scalindua sp.]